MASTLSYTLSFGISEHTVEWFCVFFQLLLFVHLLISTSLFSPRDIEENGQAKDRSIVLVHM